MDKSTIIIHGVSMGRYSAQTYHLDISSDDTPRNDVALAINCCGIAKVTPGVNTTPRTRRDFYLIYMIQGELTASLGGSKFVLTEGEYICLPPETEHFYRCSSSESVKYFWIHFTGRDANEVLCETGISLMVKYKSGEISEVSELYELLFGEFRLRHNNLVYRSALVLRNILMRIATVSCDEEEQKNALDNSIRYIHTHLSGDLSVKKLAQMEYLSQGYYRTLFKQVTGVSPSEYVAAQRINRAAQLLLETDMSISRICEAVGISDRLYFQRFFKKHTAMTPSKYRATK